VFAYACTSDDNIDLEDREEQGFFLREVSSPVAIETPRMKQMSDSKCILNPQGTRRTVQELKERYERVHQGTHKLSMGFIEIIVGFGEACPSISLVCGLLDN
jgi:hypothetical protein